MGVAHIAVITLAARAGEDGDEGSQLLW